MFNWAEQVFLTSWMHVSVAPERKESLYAAPVCGWVKRRMAFSYIEEGEDIAERMKEYGRMWGWWPKLRGLLLKGEVMNDGKI